MPIVSARDIYKAFDLRRVLEGISLTVHTGERVGVVGANGSGKSTLGAILAGVVAPDSGTVAVRRGAKVAYLAQEPRFAAHETVLDAVLSGLDEWNAARARFDAAVAALEGGTGDIEHWIAEQTAAAEEIEHHGGWDRVHEAENLLGRLGVGEIDADVATLSGGRRRAVALAKVLLSRPTLAILDEPTNHLDLGTIEWLEGHLADDYEGALVLITHDRYVLDRVATRTVEIESGVLYSYDGGFESYLAAKAERALHAERVEANRQNFLRQELEWLRRSPKARTTKQKARIQRAEKAAGEPAPVRERVAALTLDAARTGKTLLAVEHLCLAVGGWTLVDDLTLHLVPGERVGIVGPNGCGKTTLLSALVGRVSPQAGTITVGQNTRIAYLDQLRAELDESATVEENVAEGRSQFEIGERTMSVRTYLERFLFSPTDARRNVATLSGGERARVALAKILASSANLLVLDEPTNDLDVSTLAALEAMILDFAGTALIVSHDRWFLDRLTTSILAFEEGGVVRRYHGNYAAYREAASARRARDTAAEKASTAARTKAGPDAQEVARKLTQAERRELDSLMPRIEAAEQDVVALEAELANPSSYAGGGEGVRDLLRRLDDARAQVADLIARWDQLEERRA
jgi:ATP-binding cassette subfamily F protein uup